MFDYLRGKITKQFANYITVDVNGVGYKIYVSNPYRFTLNEETTVYVEKLPHTVDEEKWTVEKKATCAEKGRKAEADRQYRF